MSNGKDYEYCCECPNVLQFRERYFTNYLSSVYVNKEIMKTYNITDSTSFRVFLQNNAEMITKMGINSIFDTDKCSDKYKTNNSLYTEDYKIKDPYVPPSNLYFKISNNSGLSNNYQSVDDIKQ